MIDLTSSELGLLEIALNSLHLCADDCPSGLNAENCKESAEECQWKVMKRNLLHKLLTEGFNKFFEERHQKEFSESEDHKEKCSSFSDINTNYPKKHAKKFTVVGGTTKKDLIDSPKEEPKDNFDDWRLPKYPTKRQLKEIYVSDDEITVENSVTLSKKISKMEDFSNLFVHTYQISSNRFSLDGICTQQECCTPLLDGEMFLRARPHAKEFVLDIQNRKFYIVQNGKLEKYKKEVN